MHVLLGDATYGQMNTEEKSYRSSQGKADEVVSQAILIEGLSFSALSDAVARLKKEHSFVENDNILINYYCCQHVLTKQDLFGV